MNTSTVFCDIDGTLIRQDGGLLWRHLPALPHAVAKLTEWRQAGASIVLTTARPESLRFITSAQLHRLGIPYDQLVMGLGTGPRVLINNQLEGSDDPTAFAYNVPMNTGLGSVDL